MNQERVHLLMREIEPVSTFCLIDKMEDRIQIWFMIFKKWLKEKWSFQIVKQRELEILKKKNKTKNLSDKVQLNISILEKKNLANKRASISWHWIYDPHTLFQADSKPDTDHNLSIQ